jgi:primosomal protein N' (replication factor Y) (superfamily II helicase)
VVGGLGSGPGRHARVKEPDEPEALPGLREAVKGSKASAARRRAAQAAAAEPAATDPVAQVLVDVPLVHLDRTFDYLVPVAMDALAVPGARVKVRFAGREVGGYLLARVSETDHPGRLSPLRRVVSAEPVLSPVVAELAGDVAARYAGTRSDVLRLAVPPRHAATERAEPAPPATPGVHDASAAAAAWAEHPQADAFLRRLAAGESPRAVWGTPPGCDWPHLLAHAAVAAYSGSGRGVLLCVPDAKDVVRVDRALTDVLGPGQHVSLTAQPGPARRYRDFLAVSRGARRVVVGTRAAAFAPVHDLGLVVIWDDGDDLHAEPRAPYPHTRETLLLRAEREGAAALLGGFARSVEADQLLRSGWAHELDVPRERLRELVTVRVAGASDAELARDPFARAARMPSAVHEVIGGALASGPVLVQTPRLGYAAALACERCRTAARCPALAGACQGPLTIPRAAAAPRCGWCGTDHPSWSCAVCGHRGLRAPVVGDTRTAEELGRTFPSTPVRTSSSGHTVLADVGAQPAIVVATPGAEPVAEGGYAAVVLLDTWLMLARPDLRTTEEAVRRWANAVGLLRPGGSVVAVGDPAHPGLQALVRWDLGGLATREAAERATAHLPPASRLATITGEPGAVDDALTLLSPPEATEALGPVPVGDGEVRLVVRAPRAQATALSRALLELQRVRSARKLDAVRVQVDPPSL